MPITFEPTMRLSLPAAAPRATAATGDGPTIVNPQPGQFAQVRGSIDQAQRFFARYGLGAAQGNGPGLAIAFAANYPNAAYVPASADGAETMLVGSDPVTGKSYASADDVIFHEYTHRVVTSLLHLDPTGESGVVNESLADTFAEAIRGGTDWTMGSAVHPGGVRSMSDPGAARYAQAQPDGTVMRMPSTVYEYQSLPNDTADDHGGVHTNIGIPNRAASLIGQQLGKQAMADIYMGAVRNYMTSTSGIADTARATLRSAASMFGGASPQAQAVTDAWRAVGLDARTGMVIPRGSAAADAVGGSQLVYATGSTLPRGLGLSDASAAILQRWHDGFSVSDAGSDHAAPLGWNLG